MSWEECKKEFIRSVDVDPEKINSLVGMAKRRLNFVKSIKTTEENASFIFDDYYEVIKELLIALMLKKGIRSKNHQCLFTFFAKEFNYEAEVNIIKQMNYLRNRLDYYAEPIEYAYFQENYKSFESIINLLLKLIKK